MFAVSRRIDEASYLLAISRIVVERTKHKDNLQHARGKLRPLSARYVLILARPETIPEPGCEIHSIYAKKQNSKMFF